MTLALPLSGNIGQMPRWASLNTVRTLLTCPLMYALCPCMPHTNWTYRFKGNKTWMDGWMDETLIYL